MADLRSYIFLDSLQPQVASFFATVSGGFLPIAGQASLFVEISPGMEINRVTDIALKSTKVTPGMQMILPGHTLLTMECGPAAYAAFAANEAEKAANINILEIRAFGSFGRLYIGGDEKDVDVAAKAAEQAINSVTGREMKGSGGG